MKTTTDWSAEMDEIDELTATDQQFAPRPDINVDIADGGYLSWLYGSAEIRHQAWPPKFVGNKPLIVMDSRGPLFRKQRNPGYKVGREEKRENDPEWKDRTPMVHNFREIIEEEDGRFRFVRIEGLEADDLVALASWYRRRKINKPTKPLYVMGIDKDFLQLGNLVHITDKDGIPVQYWRFQRRLPVALQRPLITEGWQVLLTLALMGDKSDSIPRLLAPRTPGLSFLNELYSCTLRQAFERAFDEYGRPFLANLYDVILPDPHIFGMDPGDVFDMLITGGWSSGLYNKIDTHIREEVDSWNLSASRSLKRSSPKSRTPLNEESSDDAFDA